MQTTSPSPPNPHERKRKRCVSIMENISGEMDSVVYCLVKQKVILQWTVQPQICTASTNS